MLNPFKRLVIKGVSFDVKDGGAVRFDESTSLTDAQKTMARDNIGAGGGNVTSVNGQSGEVELNAEDVNALPDDISIEKGTDTNGYAVKMGMLDGNTASGEASFAFGRENTATGNYSTAIGRSNTASGSNSVAMGRGNVASANAACAFGYTSTASGATSVASGWNCQATEQCAHAEGQLAIASGSGAHAEGYHTTASGVGSHAEGRDTIASGGQCHVEGYGTIGNHWIQSVSGAYNIADPSENPANQKGDFIEIVGNGESDNSRSNARTLDWQGNEVLAGKVTVGTDPTNDMDLTTKRYVDTNPSYMTVSIPYGQCDSSSTATAFTVTVPGITELRDGVMAMVKNGVITSASGCTLNINGLGAKPIYQTLAAASAITTQFNINYTMLFVYDTSRVSAGCWLMFYGYNTDNNTIGYQIRTSGVSMAVDGATYRYRLLFQSKDGDKFVPANTSSSSSATTAKTVNQTPINPFGVIMYYGTTTTVSNASKPNTGHLWEQYNDISLGYSFNVAGRALTLTTSKPVYLKCAPQSDGTAIMDSSTPIVQDLPTTEDGKIYIFLGIASSATQFTLMLQHPVYYFKDNAIRVWTNAVELNASDVGIKIGTATPTTADISPGQIYLKYSV